jgi:DNA helicase-2/ATP-dependent DNA helicase PcrA
MKFYADLHVHSHYSRATSKDLDLEHLFLWAQLKGIHVVGTGDCVHPGWMDEIKAKLEPAEEGFLRLKSSYTRKISKDLPPACQGEVRFVLTAEISNIYKKLGKVRKVHNIICAPSLKAAEKIQARLDLIGNIRADGRPILGLDSRDLLEIILEADARACLIPAHIWTPWFSVLGSSSGFDRMEDCFGDLTKHIFAVETGLSSDPWMNWRLKQLDPFVLVSNSDAHSPSKMGREATIYDAEFSYEGIYRALADVKDKGLIGTIEFFPEEGKYHYDGHRACKMRLHPQETQKHQGLCPACGKPVTVGVMARVEALADRPEGERPPRGQPYYNLIPLAEVIAEAKGVQTANTKSVQESYGKILARLGNELFVLREASLKDIGAVAGDFVAEGIRRMREGKVRIAAGYDGEYGEIYLFTEEDRNAKEGQLTFHFPSSHLKGDV